MVRLKKKKKSYSKFAMLHIYVPEISGNCRRRDIVLVQKYCIGIEILHWYRDIQHKKKQKSFSKFAMLHIYVPVVSGNCRRRDIVLIQKYCIGTEELHWYRDTVLVQRYTA